MRLYLSGLKSCIWVMDRNANNFTVAYLLGEYPSRTESFIANEIDRVGRKLPVCVFACGGDRGIRLGDYRQQVIYAPKPWQWAMAGAHARICLRHPIRYGRALLSAARTSPRIRALHAFSLAAYFADRAKEVSAGHLHAHFAGFPAEVAMSVCALTGLQFSISAHAHDIYAEDAALPQKLSRALFTVTCTEFNLHFLQRLADGDSCGKIHLVYHGIPLADWPFVPQPHAPGDAVRLLFVGRLVAKKGLADLLEAVSLLVRRQVDVELDVVGDGPLRRESERLAGRYGISGRVHFLGWRSRAETARLYRSAAILVQPSVVAADGDRDGIPNVLLEAMASGLPVVSTPVSGIPEVLNDRNSELVAPGDPGAIAAAIGRLAADEIRRMEVIRNARETVLQFDMDEHIRFLLSLFSRYLGLEHAGMDVSNRKQGRIFRRRQEDGGIDA